jgi:multiple sugar transport system permease protein
MSKRRGKRNWFKTRTGREALAFYCFVSPWVIGFVVLGVGMLLAGLVVTFTDYDGLMTLDRVKFSGLDNYARVLRDERLPLAFKNTAIYALISVPLGVALSLSLALMLNQKIRGKSVFRTLFYIPYVVPMVAAVVAWKIMVDKNAGLVNGVLSLFRPGTAIHWLAQERVRAVLILLTLWTGAGGGMVIFLAGLQGVPRELKEAAIIDGANSWQVFRNVTAPLLSPVVFFQLTMGIIGAMQVLMQSMMLSTPVAGPYGVAGGGLSTQPTKSIYMWTNHAMVEIFGRQRYGYGVVLLWMMFLVVALLSISVFKTARYWVHYEVEQ